MMSLSIHLKITIFKTVNYNINISNFYENFEIFLSQWKLMNAEQKLFSLIIRPLFEKEQ